MDQYELALIGGGDGETCRISVDQDSDPCRIVFHYRARTIEAEASDFFEALCLVRLQLEKERLTPYCYGASLNVYPSAMARDMGAGLKAYKIQIGCDANMEDLVRIFASGPDVTPASVAAQRAHFEEWLRSDKR